MPFPLVDTKNPEQVADSVKGIFRELYPAAPSALVDQLFADVDLMFTGRYLDYQPIDIGYHDYEHTLQATLCFALIFRGREKAKAEPRLGVRQFELGLASVLLHDTGYLKLRSDREGSSAKYTHVHVLRSGAIAASYAPNLGFTAQEAELIANVIHCTGHSAALARLYFNSPQDRLLGSMLVTADYLGQMAALDYCEELETLYAEFLESDLHYNQRPEHHAFKSAKDLIQKTPSFWSKVVLPKLQKDYDGMYAYLAAPYPDGPNPYLASIENNLRRLENHQVDAGHNI